MIEAKTLNEREREAFKYLAMGLTDYQISRRMNCTKKSANHICNNILKKLNLKSRYSLIWKVNFLEDEQEDYFTKHLTDRELETCSYIFKGFSNKEIGERMFLSELTVKYHISNIFKKLKVSSIRQLISLYLDSLLNEDRDVSYLPRAFHLNYGENLDKEIG